MPSCPPSSAMWGISWVLVSWWFWGTGGGVLGAEGKQALVSLKSQERALHPWVASDREGTPHCTLH